MKGKTACLNFRDKTEQIPVAFDHSQEKSHA